MNGEALMNTTEEREVLNREPTALDPVCREILKAVAGIQYGSVEVLIHDSRVVQIEAREKIRFTLTRRRRSAVDLHCCIRAMHCNWRRISIAELIGFGADVESIK